MKLVSHQFAFYTEHITQSIERAPQSTLHTITDLELVHRISSVLRLQVGETIILFNNSHHSTVHIVALHPKKSIVVEIESIEVNRALTPSITWLLPMLKREAFESALYTLTELGAQTIQPLITRKSNTAWWSEKEVLRTKKIMISAAEQSKQYMLPLLLPIISLDLWLLKDHSQAVKIFFDPAGISLEDSIALIKKNHIQDIIACVGPEGDLTEEEKEALVNHAFILCRLTKTVLRAQQALTVGLGALRSLL